MEIEVKKIYEKGNSLVVEVECPYGLSKFGLSLSSKYLDLDDVPLWKKEVKKLLEQKYSKELGIEKEVFKEHCKKHASIDDFMK